MNDPVIAPPAVGLPRGTIVAGKYRIDGFLGAGGMGVVLSATHLDLEAPVAIKLMREELAKNEEVVARMLFEARAVARMRGAHVVRVLDVGVLDVEQPGAGTPFIVMEQLTGADLASTLVKGGALSPRAAVELVLQACEGLNEAHALGIVHRDLKPENLFLANTPEGVVLKILDFGVSKDVGTAFEASPRAAVTNAGFAVGSPHYMAPEQMRASLEIDARADIWSLGAILFELVAGKCPFDGDSLPVIYTQVLAGAAPSLLELSSSAPAELDAIIRRCLAKDPNQRYQSATELAVALRDFLAAEGVTTAEMQRIASGINLRSGASWPPAPAARSRGRLGAVSLLASAVIAVFALYFWHARSNARLLAQERAEQGSMAAPAPIAPARSEPSPDSALVSPPPASAPSMPAEVALTSASALNAVDPPAAAKSRGLTRAPVTNRLPPTFPAAGVPAAEPDEQTAAKYPVPVPPLPESLPAVPEPATPAPVTPAQDSAPTAPPPQAPTPPAQDPVPPAQEAEPHASQAPAPTDGAPNN